MASLKVLNDPKKVALIQEAVIQQIMDQGEVDPSYLRDYIGAFVYGRDTETNLEELGDNERAAEVLGFDPETGEEVD